MKNYFYVLRLLLANMFRKTEGKKSNHRMTVYIILGAIALLMSFVVATSVGPMAVHFNDVNNLLAVLFIVAFFAVIFFSLFSMLAHLYFSKDSEFFLSLPIKPSVIYFAKLTIVYLIELLVVLIAIVPSIIMIGFSLTMGAVYYIVMLLAVLIVPMFPLVFTSLISIPLMYLVSFFKRQGAAASIILILLFGGLMSAYMYFAIDFGSTDHSETAVNSIADMVAAIEGSFHAWSKMFFPFYAIARVATLSTTHGSLAASVLINLLIFICSAAVLFLAAIFVSNKAYRRGMARSLENRASTSKNGKDVKHSAIKSLMIQEWREIFRNTTYAFQCISCVVLAPLMNIVMLFMLRNGEEDLSEILYYMWLISGSIISFFVVTLNISAQTAITRQGKAFYYSKIIPVDYTTQVKAKIYLYMTISSVATLLSTISSLFFLPNWWIAPAMLCFVLVLNYSATCFSVWYDLKDPMLDWTTCTEAIKHNKNVMVNSLINILCMFGVLSILSAIYAALTYFLASFGAFLSFLIMAGLMLIPASIFHKMLYKNLNMRYWELP